MKEMEPKHLICKNLRITTIMENNTIENYLIEKVGEVDVVLSKEIYNDENKQEVKRLNKLIDSTECSDNAIKLRAHANKNKIAA